MAYMQKTQGAVFCLALIIQGRINQSFTKQLAVYSVTVFMKSVLATGDFTALCQNRIGK
jgi:hypothetical protein